MDLVFVYLSFQKILLFINDTYVGQITKKKEEDIKTFPIKSEKYGSS